MNLDKPQQSRVIDASLNGAGVLVVVLLIGVFYALVYQPLGTQREDHLSRIEQLDRLIEQSQGVQGNHRILREELRALWSSIAAAQERLPNESQEEAFIKRIEEVATATGLQILDQRRRPASVLQTHSESEIHFNCTGSFTSVCQFLQEVSQLARIAKISNLNIESGKESQEYPFQVTFVLYYGVESNDISKQRGV